MKPWIKIVNEDFIGLKLTNDIWKNRLLWITNIRIAAPQLTGMCYNDDDDEEPKIAILPNLVKEHARSSYYKIHNYFRF